MFIKPQPGILDIEPYVPGKSASGSTSRIIKLSSNESAYGCSPKATEAYLAHASSLRRYPDGSATNLRTALAGHYQIPEESLICGAGSDELIALIIQAYAGVGDEVLYSEYGFLMYPISTRKVGAVPVKAKEKHYRTDVEALRDHVTPKTKIVFVANPNNPTGSHISKQEMTWLRHHLPEHVLLVIDAAYAEYVTEADYDAGWELVASTPNTIMLRTFSKIYGLASLRLGYAYCPKEIADVLNRLRGPFNVSSPALACGVAALHDTKFVEKAKLNNDASLGYLMHAYRDLGLIPHPSQGNFILVEFPKNEKHSAALANRFLEEHGILVRDVSPYNLNHCLRISIGTQDENSELLEQLKLFMT